MTLPVDNFADVIAEFAIPGGLTLERRGVGTVNIYREVVPGAPSTIALDPVAVVPTTGRGAQRGVDEVQRETIDVYAVVELMPGTRTNVVDVLTYNGRRWSILRVQDYGAAGGAWIGSAELAEAVTP